MHRGGGTVVAGSEYGLSEATQGLTRLDLREQELRDMEVARRMQEEEIKVRQKKMLLTNAKRIEYEKYCRN